MKIRKLFNSRIYPYHMVLETTGGAYMKFLITPARVIGENDLTPLPYYRAVGRNEEEAPEYLYKMYGLEKDEKKEAKRS